jgi:type VI secretion system protein ImpG
MLPFPQRSFVGYGIIQEYFSFPDKFLFLDLGGFEEIRAAGFGNAAEIIFLIAPFERPDRRSTLEVGVNQSVFRLGCTPVINLFQQMSEPILLTQKQHEYLLVADARRRETVEIFSIDEVLAVTPDKTEPLRFQPLYSHRHTTDSASPQLFWSSVRRPSGWRRGGATDIYLSFVDLSSRVIYPTQDAAMARVTCYNGDLPSLLPFGQAQSDFELQDAGPIRRIVALVKPTPVLHPPLGKPLLWRLISQLSLNYLSLVDGGEEALQEILRLHNFADHAAGERQIQGIRRLRSSPTYARVASDDGISFARGRRIDIDFDEEHFAGGGVFLFASVLERFFGMYATINSYTALSARTQQRKSPLHEWAPRAGWKPLM